ncbi:MAG TPA: hypothetical protein VMI54_09675 [Polyangiaceae bacterium]|nr:hypothetical protein [Polyangiaceae bacterium]
MTEPGWLGMERPLSDLFRQSLRFVRAGLKAPLWFGLGALGLAALLGFGATLYERSFTPRVVLRVIEADRDPGSMPELKRRLGDYVREGVFTSEPLLDLVRRYHLYPKLAGNPRRAVEAFRRDLDVDVYQNYFVEQRSENEAPRSARVAVSYRSTDRDTALAVTRDLGALVIIRMTAEREAQAKRASESAKAGAETLEQALLTRLARIAEKQHEVASGATPDPSTQVELVSLLGSVPALELEVDAAERRAATLDLGADLEARGIGLRFDIAEDADAPLFDRRSRLRLLGLGGSFVLGLPLVLLTVGAFNTARGTV